MSAPQQSSRQEPTLDAWFSMLLKNLLHDIRLPHQYKCGAESCRVGNAWSKYIHIVLNLVDVDFIEQKEYYQ